MAQTRKRAKNTLDVNSPAKIRMMEALMGKGRSGVVSYVLVYAPWCGACRKFRKNIWDPSMRFSAKHNRIAIRDDVFNNSPFAKKVPDLKYLPSMILVDEKGDVQMNAAPEGPTNILPTPTSVDQLVKMANVNVKPLSVAKQANQANQADAVNDILSKPTNMNNVIANANKTAQIAKNAAAQVKANTVALNNASRNMLARAIVNTKVAAENARKAAGNAKESANSIRNMLGEIKNIVASAKGNTNASTNMAAKAAVAAAVAAAAAEAAEDAANEGVNAVEDANANNMNANMNNMNTNANNMNANANNVNANANNVNANVNANMNNVNAYNTNDEEANTNAVNYEDWEKEELMDMIPDEEYNNASNFSPPDGMMSKNGSLTTKYPTPPVAPQNYKKPSNMVGGKRPSHGNLYKMLVSMNNRTTQRKRHATSKKLTRRTN
jgi:thiol-disulfide isomerase/thioredoxin